MLLKLYCYTYWLIKYLKKYIIPQENLVYIYNSELGMIDYTWYYYLMIIYYNVGLLYILNLCGLQRNSDYLIKVNNNRNVSNYYLEKKTTCYKLLKGGYKKQCCKFRKIFDIYICVKDKCIEDFQINHLIRNIDQNTLLIDIIKFIPYTDIIGIKVEYDNKLFEYNLDKLTGLMIKDIIKKDEK